MKIYDPAYTLSALAVLEETENHDMIYANERLYEGVAVDLTAAGTDVCGNLRYRVMWKNLILGFVVMRGPSAGLFEHCENLHAEIALIHRRKYHIPNEIDLRIWSEALRKVS